MSGWLNAGVGIGNVNINGNLMVDGDNIVNGIINLNSEILSTSSGNLLLNGNVIGGSTIVTNLSDWATFPAIADINVDYKDIKNSNVITTNVLTSNVLTSNIISSVTLFDGSRPSTCGQFISLTSQPVFGANTETPLTFDASPVQSGISFSPGFSELTFDYGGKYKVDISIQFDKSGGGTDVVDVWIRINGFDVPNSGSQCVVDGTNGETVLTVPYILALGAGDKLEVVMASSDPTMTATCFPGISTPYVRPRIPSLIVTCQIIL